MKYLIAAMILTTLPLHMMAEARVVKNRPAQTSVAKHKHSNGGARRNPCAEYGAGFVRMEGTSTCIRMGGSIGVGAGGGR